MDSQDKATGFEGRLETSDGYRAKHWWGPGGEAPGSKLVLGDLTGIFTHLQGMEIIISLIKKCMEF